MEVQVSLQHRKLALDLNQCNNKYIAERHDICVTHNRWSVLILMYCLLVSLKYMQNRMDE